LDFDLINIMRTLFISIIAFMSPIMASAQGYTPLAPLPGVSNNSTVTSLGAYLSDIFLLGVAIAGILAVVMLVIAGIEYIGGASSESARKDAKDRIWAAIFGLLLALGAWLILSTINTNILQVQNYSLNPTLPPTSGASTPSAPQYCFSHQSKSLSRPQTSCFPNITSCQLGEKQIMQGVGNSIVAPCQIGRPTAVGNTAAAPTPTTATTTATTITPATLYCVYDASGVLGTCRLPLATCTALLSSSVYSNGQCVAQGQKPTTSGTPQRLRCYECLRGTRTSTTVYWCLDQTSLQSLPSNYSCSRTNNTNCVATGC